MKFAARPPRQWILAAAALGTLLRLAFATLYWVDKPLTHDEREYLALARSLSAGRGFVYETAADPGNQQQFGRAPGYPVFLALVGAGRTEHASSPTTVKLAQAAVGGFTVWLIGTIAWRACGARAGIAAAALAAVYPPLVWIPSYVFSETLYSAVALLAADRLQQAVSGAPSRAAPTAITPAIVAGALAGGGILIRPALLFFLPLAGAWLLARRRVVLAIAFVAVALAVVAPWTARNARVHGRFVLIASEGGVTFWTGNHPLARGEGDLAANPALKMAELEFRQRHPGLAPEALEPLYYGEALRWIAGNPGQWLALLGRKAFYTVVPIGPSYTLHSTKYWAASVISYSVVLALSLLGIRRLISCPQTPAAVLLLGAAAILVGLVFFPQERFRIPVIDPVLIIAASAIMTRCASGRAGAPP